MGEKPSMDETMQVTVTIKRSTWVRLREIVHEESIARGVSVSLSTLMREASEQFVQSRDRRR